MFLHPMSFSNLKAFPEFSSQSGFHNTCFHGLFLRHWKIVSEKRHNKVILNVRFPTTTLKENKAEEIVNKRRNTNP